MSLILICVCVCVCLLCSRGGSAVYLEMLELWKGIMIEQLRACGVEAGTRMFVNLGFGISDSYFHLADVFQAPTSCQVLL